MVTIWLKSPSRYLRGVTKKSYLKYRFWKLIPNQNSNLAYLEYRRRAPAVRQTACSLLWDTTSVCSREIEGNADQSACTIKSVLEYCNRWLESHLHHGIWQSIFMLCWLRGVRNYEPTRWPTCPAKRMKDVISDVNCKWELARGPGRKKVNAEDVKNAATSLRIIT